MAPVEPGPAADLETTLAELRAVVTAGLDGSLPGADSVPPVLAEAMRYSALAGGKRIRPILVLLACRAHGGRDADALPAACAVEMIHTYSLIHDDLPAMDDDTLRRGQPSNHVRFGEAVAILAGDALLTLAFELVADRTPHRERVPRIVSTLARAVGPAGMVGGQVLDVVCQGRRVGRRALEEIHARKTAAFLGAAARIGGEAAGAGEREVAILEEYGRSLGIAFQAIDDVLDEEGSSERLGKTAGKDRRSDKATSTSVFGLEGARRRAAAYSREARRLAARIPDGEVLAAIADRLLVRES